MRATGPAARPAHSVEKLRARELDPAAPRLRFLGVQNPANPFIAREWRNIFPCGSRRRRRSKGFSQVRWHLVRHAAHDSFFSHENIVSILLRKLICAFHMPMPKVSPERGKEWKNREWWSQPRPHEGPQRVVQPSKPKRDLID